MCQWIAATCICDPATEIIKPSHSRRKRLRQYGRDV
jgi:hypothetical protein